MCDPFYFLIELLIFYTDLFSGVFTHHECGENETTLKPPKINFTFCCAVLTGETCRNNVFHL